MTRAAGSRRDTRLSCSGRIARSSWWTCRKPSRLERAARSWRQAIDQGTDTPADAARLGRLLWAPLARALPAGTTTVYLAPEGELARLPWAALPGRKPGTVLLEDLALAVVPHGPFLLQNLKYPPRYAAGPETVLALGDVDYGASAPGPYPPLPATAAELRQVFALAGTRARLVLEKSEASWPALQEALPRARYAHLATHGFFNERALREEQRRLQQQRAAWDFQPERTTQPRGLGLRSPLSYTGLALAEANLRRRPAAS